MAAITITDLPTNRVLDGKAMSSIRGALHWINGAFVPYAPPSPRALPFVNYYYNITNFVAEEITFQVVDISNSGNNSNITTVLIAA